MLLFKKRHLYLERYMVHSFIFLHYELVLDVKIIDTVSLYCSKLKKVQTSFLEKLKYFKFCFNIVNWHLYVLLPKSFGLYGCLSLSDNRLG